MAAYNIGPKIGIEGEKEFRAQISRINKEYSAMESYTKAVSTAMQQQGKSQELLASKANSLRQQLNLQQQKFEELYKALNKARESFDENSQEVLRFEGAILDVKNTTAALQRELDATDDELRRMAAGIEDVGDAAEVADDKVLSFGDMLKAGIASGAILNTLERAGDLIVEVGSQSIEAAAEVKAANAQFRQTFGDLEATATSALRSISDETGIAVTRLQGGYTALYAFTKSVGGDQDTALNIAQRALTAAADSAAYYDRTMEDATETLQSFLKGNYENDAALGIAATETTRNAKANELYAKSFMDLTEAQKVDTLLAMVEAGNKASGALGQAAREADSWANVTGELNEATRQLLAQLGGPVLEGLIPLIQGVTEGVKGLTDAAAYQNLAGGIDDFREGLEKAETTLSTTKDDIAATAGLAEQYIKKLQELEEAGLKTADSQREYKQVVELLNTLYPDLNLYIDENTGLLSESTEALARNVDALKRQAEEQARQAYFTAIVEELTAVQKERYAAEMRLVELEAKQAELLRQGAQAVDLYAAAEAEAAGKGAEFWASLSEQDKALYEVQREITATKGTMEALDKELAIHEEKLDSATAAYQRMEEQARRAGRNTGAGLAQGIRNSVPEVEDAMRFAARRGQEAYNREMQIRSPSRKMMQSADYTMDGLVLQLERRTRDVEKAMGSAAKAGANAYLKEQLDLAAQYPAMVAGAPGYSGSTTTNNRSVAYGGISININTQPGQDAQSIADAVLQELTVRLGQEEAAF